MYSSAFFACLLPWAHCSNCTLYLLACQVRVTVGDSGLCCCINSLCLWILDVSRQGGIYFLHPKTLLHSEHKAHKLNQDNIYTFPSRSSVTFVTILWGGHDEQRYLWPLLFWRTPWRRLVLSRHHHQVPTLLPAASTGQVKTCYCATNHVYARTAINKTRCKNISTHTHI